jgi:hypothetical protein
MRGSKMMMEIAIRMEIAEHVIVSFKGWILSEGAGAAAAADAQLVVDFGTSEIREFEALLLLGVIAFIPDFWLLDPFG